MKKSGSYLSALTISLDGEEGERAEVLKLVC